MVSRNGRRDAPSAIPGGNVQPRIPDAPERRDPQVRPKPQQLRAVAWPARRLRVYVVRQGKPRLCEEAPVRWSEPPTSLLANR